MHKIEKQKMVAPDVKQVILVRNDLKMSPGKAAAQVGHAAILFMVNGFHEATDQNKFVCPSIRELQWMFGNGPIPQENGSIAYGGMKKIVLGVDDLTHLWALHWEAKDAGLKVFNVFDEGVNDITACAIGPDYSKAIDKITGDLDLYGPAPKPHKTWIADGSKFDVKFTFDADETVTAAFKKWEKLVAEAVTPISSNEHPWGGRRRW